jgi:hypothetical protein
MSLGIIKSWNYNGVADRLCTYGNGNTDKENGEKRSHGMMIIDWFFFVTLEI